MNYRLHNLLEPSRTFQNIPEKGAWFMDLCVFSENISPTVLNTRDYKVRHFRCETQTLLCSYTVTRIHNEFPKTGTCVFRKLKNCPTTVIFCKMFQVQHIYTGPVFLSANCPKSPPEFPYVNDVTHGLAPLYTNTYTLRVYRSGYVKYLICTYRL